jgi:hypothetical protein
MGHRTTPTAINSPAPLRCWRALPCFAPPPLVTGDVPTADEGMFEWYVGGGYQHGGESIGRALPFTELVYGITTRWEITAEAEGLSKSGEYGFGDMVLGTKFVVLPENETRPGVALSFETAAPTGDEDNGLGTGAPEYELRARAQERFGWFTPIVNLGYTIVEEPKIGGVAESRENTWRASFAQEWQVGKNTKPLSEIYGKSSGEPGGEERLAAQVGFKHKFSEKFQVAGALGKSIRDDEAGGPELRAYLGVRFNFDAPWNRN